jgi:hypothetical protein
MDSISFKMNGRAYQKPAKTFGRVATNLFQKMEQQTLKKAGANSDQFVILPANRGTTGNNAPVNKIHQPGDY